MIRNFTKVLHKQSARPLWRSLSYPWLALVLLVGLGLFGCRLFKGSSTPGFRPTLSWSYSATVRARETATIQFTLDQVSSQAVTLDYTTADGSGIAGRHYTATSGRLTIAPGSRAASFPVKALLSSTSGAVSFKIKVSNVTNADLFSAEKTISIEDHFAAGNVGRYASSDGYPAGVWDNIIDGQTFTAGLTLDGAAWNNTLVINSRISGDRLKINNVQNVYIKNNDIFDVPGPGIYFSGAGATDDIIIEGNHIYNTGDDGIHMFRAAALPTDVRIINNEIHHTGLNHPLDPLYHGIYVMVPGVWVENNLIYNSSDVISIRSSGTVVRNVIYNIDAGSGIVYFNNHPAPAGSTFTIENNLVYSVVANGVGYSNTNRGLIALLTGGASTIPDTFNVRFNTVVMLNQTYDGNGPYYPVFSQGGISAKTYNFYGNLLVNPLTTTYHTFATMDYNFGNSTSQVLTHFQNTEAPYDFHLTVSHPAINTAFGASSNPATDRDGTARPGTGGRMSSGAYQY